VAKILSRLEALERKLAPAQCVAQTIVNQSTTINVQTVINTWDSKDRLVVSLDLIRGAFRESEMLREYCSLPEKNRQESEFVTMYVLEALMAIIRRAHASPEGRNIRLHPHRADQVQVLTREGREQWEILTLVEAVQLLFREAATKIESLTRTSEARRTMSPAEKDATVLMPLEYRRQPTKYEREGKGRVAAHLASLGSRSTAPITKQDERQLFDHSHPPSPDRKQPDLPLSALVPPQWTTSDQLS
jgi:hypothetical protein